MFTMRLRFPGGRYHATPWGSNVNEGQIEWPPSPWRILRALLACGFNTQRWREVPLEAITLIEKLAATLPKYTVPTVSAAHSRHFMTSASGGMDRGKRFLAIDVWADVGDGVVEVRWDCELSEKERDMAHLLARSLGYIGRSESWVDASVSFDECGQGLSNVFPVEHGTCLNAASVEQISLIAPLAPKEYQDLRHSVSEGKLAALPLPSNKRRPSKKLLEARANVSATFPETLVHCLLKDRTWWSNYHWSFPPGARQVGYYRPVDSIRVGPTLEPPRPPVQRVSTMLLSLTPIHPIARRLPPRTLTLPLAELIHRSLIAIAANGLKIRCPELTGRDDLGKPRLDHDHAYVIPADLDADGRVDHVILHAAMGLGIEAQQAVQELRKIQLRDFGELSVTICGSGGLDAQRSLANPWRPAVQQLLGGAFGAEEWVSVSPFVAPRHLKKHGKDTLEGQVNAELASRHLPLAKTVEVLETNSKAIKQFVLTRSNPRNAAPQEMGYFLRLKLTSQSLGPVCLGYASHFGMGAFKAVSPR